jgi:hypothetical protein
MYLHIYFNIWKQTTVYNNNNYNLLIGIACSYLRGLFIGVTSPSNEYMYIHIYIYIYIYIHIYVHICIYMRLKRSVRTYIYIYIHICRYNCLYLRGFFIGVTSPSNECHQMIYTTYKYMCKWVYIYEYVYINLWMHIYIL